MTELAFHTGMDDPVGYACRLLRKAVRAGIRVAVFGPSPLLDRLDQALWTFEPLEFIAHLAWREASPPDEARLARTPVVLMHAAAAATAGPVGREAFGAVVSIDAAESDPIWAAHGFDRVIEIVGTDPEPRRAGRQRWRAYEQAGLTPRHVEAATAR